VNNYRIKNRESKLKKNILMDGS